MQAVYSAAQLAGAEKKKSLIYNKKKHKYFYKRFKFSMSNLIIYNDSLPPHASNFSFFLSFFIYIFLFLDPTREKYILTNE